MKRSGLEQSTDQSEYEISDSCMVKENGRLVNCFFKEIDKKLWSKATTFRVFGGEDNREYIEAVKKLEIRGGFSVEQKMDFNEVNL